jgi:hypothetical protein
MAILDTFEDSQALPDQVAGSATVMNVWRSNLAAIDDATRIGVYAYQGGFGHPQEFVAQNPYRESWGGFRYLTGMTTLTAVTRSSAVTSGDVLRVYLAGTLQATWTLANGTQTHTFNLPSYGANFAVDVVFEVYNASKPAEGASWGDFEIIAAYVSPVQLSDAYPGEPTFTNVYSPTSTQQLASAINWLVRRVSLRTRPLFQSIVRWNGPYQGQNTVRWYGSVEKSPAQNVLKANGMVLVQASGMTEQIRLRVDGTTVATYAVPTTPGDYGFTLSYTMSQATGTRLYLEVDHIRTAGGDSNQTPIARFTLNRVWTEGVGVYAVSSFPPLPIRTGVTWATVKGFLNNCRDAAATLKARIDANPDLWNRQYLFRCRYAFDAYQNQVFEPGQIACCWERVGQALLVRGKGIQLAHGPSAFNPDPKSQNEVGLYELKPFVTESLVDGDAVETALVYLDGIDGLYGGDPYNLRGVDIHYAGEIFRINPA